MKKSILYLIGIAILAMFTVLWSCKKDNNDVTNDELAAAQDESENSSTMDDIYSEADHYVKTAENNNFVPLKSMESAFGTCTPTITITHQGDNVFPKVVTINFGTDGCTSYNGKTKKGIIIVTVSNRWNVVGASRSISFENFYINERKIEGTKTVTFKGTNDKGNLYYTVDVDTRITKNDSVRTYKANRVREFISGKETPTIWDDKYSITGSGSGINRKGLAYEVSITSPLIIQNSCRWILSGVVNISIPSKNRELNIDYGDGSCSSDKTITITVNGEVKKIKLIN